MVEADPPDHVRLHPCGRRQWVGDVDAGAGELCFLVSRLAEPTRELRLETVVRAVGSVRRVHAEPDRQARQPEREQRQCLPRGVEPLPVCGRVIVAHRSQQASADTELGVEALCRERARDEGSDDHGARGSA